MTASEIVSAHRRVYSRLLPHKILMSLEFSFLKLYCFDSGHFEDFKCPWWIFHGASVAFPLGVCLFSFPLIWTVSMLLLVFHVHFIKISLCLFSYSFSRVLLVSFSCHSCWIKMCLFRLPIQVKIRVTFVVYFVFWLDSLTYFFVFRPIFLLLSIILFHFFHRVLFLMCFNFSDGRDDLFHGRRIM